MFFKGCGVCVEHLILVFKLYGLYFSKELILFDTKRYMKRISEATGSSYSSDMIRASGSELKEPRLIPWHA